jgi:hypothetical protein
MAMEAMRKIIAVFDPFVWFILIVCVIVGFMLYQANQLTDSNKYILIGVAFFGILLGLRNRERKLIGINKAKSIARRETATMQNRGEILSGNPVRYCEATLQRIEGKPQHYITASYIQAPKPFFIVFFINPYEGPEHLAIEKIKRVFWFDIEQIPDYKVIIPPDIVQYAKLKKSLEEQHGTDL